MTATATHPRNLGFFRGLWVITRLDLMQRRRSRTLLILAIVWFVVIGIVTAVTWYILGASSGAYGGSFDSYPLFSLIVYFVLLFGTLVAPAISAGSISSERSGGTLATTQVTLISTWSILIGRALAAWITGVAFLVVALPFVVLSLALAQVSVLQFALAILALTLQIGLFTCIGVGLSALISSPLFAIVTAYLVVAALSIGTLIAFVLAAGASTQYVEVENRILTTKYWDAVNECSPEDQACFDAVPLECVAQTDTISHSRPDRIWWILAMNPYVVVGDMVSIRAGDDLPSDLFGTVTYGVRSMQIPPEQPTGWDECAFSQFSEDYTSSDEMLENTVPTWWIGLALQLVLTAVSLGAGYYRLHTPANRLPKGARIA